MLMFWGANLKSRMSISTSGAAGFSISVSAGAGGEPNGGVGGALSFGLVGVVGGLFSFGLIGAIWGSSFLGVPGSADSEVPPSWVAGGLGALSRRNRYGKPIRTPAATIIAKPIEYFFIGVFLIARFALQS